MSQRLYDLTSSLRDWLASQTKEFAGDKKSSKRVKNVVDVGRDMTTTKRAIAEEIIE